MMCQLCGCDEAYDFHHLIPKTVHRNKWFKKRFTRQQMREGLEICKQCHVTIHEFVPEKQLGRLYYTRELLLAQPDMARYVAWKRRRLTLEPGTDTSTPATPGTT